MAEKKQKTNGKFKTVKGTSNLSAGVCGPNGCVLDWNKTDKQAKKAK